MIIFQTITHRRHTFGYKKIEPANFQGQTVIKPGEGKDIPNLLSERAVYLTVAIP